MLDLIKYVVEQFAEKKDEIEYLVEEKDGETDVTVVLADEDMGKVIGRQGKLAKALRAIVKACQGKDGKKYNIEIKERGEIE